MDSATPSEEDLICQLKSTERLAHFDIPVVDFISNTCDALLKPHALWLEIVHIHVQQAEEDHFENANMILASCVNLKSFAMVYYGNVDMPEDSLGLIMEPCICQKPWTLSWMDSSHWTTTAVAEIDFLVPA